MLARAWGVEDLTPLERAKKIIDAGVDQFGGEGTPELVVELVRSGEITEARIDESVRRLLREKFVLGLFDDPFLDLDRPSPPSDGTTSSPPVPRPSARRSSDSPPPSPARRLLPLAAGLRIYVEGFDSDAAARLGTLVDDPADADLAVLRLAAPWEARPGLFESRFHAGSLEYPAAERDRILQICRTVRRWSISTWTGRPSSPRSPMPLRPCWSLRSRRRCAGRRPARPGCSTGSRCRSTYRASMRRLSTAPATCRSARRIRSSASATGS